MKSVEKVDTQYKLRNGEEEDCDRCSNRASIRLTEGSSYGFYCRDCLPDVLEKQK